jgi:hypothetical protein
MNATSIIPYPDLGEMANASQCVVIARVEENFDWEDGTSIRFRSRLVVEESVKGNLQTGETFFMQKLSARGADWQLHITGDAQLEASKSYLLFLESKEDYWRPILLAYGVFENFTKDGEEYLVPVPEGLDIATFARPDGKEIEPLAVYARQTLASALQRVTSHAITWQELKVNRIPLGEFRASLQMRAPPSHCAFLGAGGGVSGTRWLDFPGTALPVRYASAGDPSCSPATLAHTRIGEGITDITTHYAGANVTNNGTFSGFTPNCTDGSAVGGNFTSWVNTNLGGNRHLVIQFNDPCNEMSFNTGTCSGTLAYGGEYSFTPTHTYDGLTWYKAAYGFVVVNNDVGSCMNSCGTNYKIMVTHEMTHALGLDHITGTGTANMNPLCCVNITSLDEDCVDYLYAPSLPVELASFKGVKNDKGIELSWVTISESENAFFTVERSSDGTDFREVAKIGGGGTSLTSQRYTWLDAQFQPGVNYYRLSQTDFNGTSETFSHIVAVEVTSQEQQLRLYKSPFSQTVYVADIFLGTPTQTRLDVYDLTGKAVFQKNVYLTAGWNTLPLDFSGFQSGWYVLQVNAGSQVWVEKLAVKN